MKRSARLSEHKLTKISSISFSLLWKCRSQASGKILILREKEHKEGQWMPEGMKESEPEVSDNDLKDISSMIKKKSMVKHTALLSILWMAITNLIITRS